MQIIQEAKNGFRRLFGADFVELRPLSATTANLLAFLSLTEYEDTIMALKLADGGHRSWNEGGVMEYVRGLRLRPLPFESENMRVATDAAVKEIVEVKPRLIILGADIFLFPFPVKEIAEAASQVGSTLMYDASMVLGLIGGGSFQNPLQEGAKVMTSTTAKTFSGPQGGVILSSEEHSKTIEKVTAENVSNYHAQRIVAIAIALNEIEVFGAEYARQTMLNARKLASSLFERGLPVMCERTGFTQTHQVLLDCSSFGGAYNARQLLLQANIIAAPCRIPNDDGTGQRNGLVVGTQEITRVGMREQEMADVSRFIEDALTQKKTSEEIRLAVKEFRKPFQNIHYSFDEGDAYRYFESIS